MSGTQFELHTLLLVPLTPLHIGGGDEARLRPEDYRLSADRQMVERVSLRAVLARLPAAERARWLKEMDRAGQTGVEAGIRALQGKAQAAEISERIPIAPASADAVDLAGAGHGRRNQIDAFFRAGGRLTLPGSSLKGALRTAWLARCASLADPPRLPALADWCRLPGKARAAEAQRAVASLFGLADGNRAQDTDPFRDVTVSDAPLPEGATRIDPVRSWKRGRDGYGLDGVGQMHRERLRSVADGGPTPLVELTIGLRAAAVRKRAGELDASRRPRADLTPDNLAALLVALEDHHRPLWQREVEEKFFAGPPGVRLRDALARFAHLSRSGADPAAALVRLGWAGHAEAKSLGPDRRIERPQAKGEGQIAREGSTRHVIELAAHPLPFGWALLVRKDRWQPPAQWLGAPAPAAAPATGATSGRRSGATTTDPRAATALGQQLRFRKGQRVLVDGEEATLLEDVTWARRDSEEVNVDFDGDREPVEIARIKER